MAHPGTRLLRLRQARIVLGASWLLAGCGATGLDWVDEAHVARPSTTSSSNQQLAVTSVIPATVELEPETPPRPRLNHTVTLGEIDVAASERAPGAPYGAVGPSVTINNYNVMNASTPGYSYGYSGVGYGRSAPSFSGGRAPASSTPALAPGQHWPTISDHGPSFPYRSGPASPWGAGSRQ
jgi:hypothetical protein